MTFQQFILILRARWLTVATTLAVALAIAVAINLFWPKKYTASTTVVLDNKAPDLVSGMLLPTLPGYLGTQIDIIKSHRVALTVVRALKLADSPQARAQFQEATGGQGSLEDWLADFVGAGVDAEPGRESAVITITYQGADPKFATVMANQFAKAYIDTTLALRVEPAKQTALFFDEQAKSLRENLEKAQARLSEYQRGKGFTAIDERLDVESARLSELSAQYTTTQAMSADASSRQRQLMEFLARGASPESLPDVLANPLLQNLKGQLMATEAKLQQVASQLGANHPEVSRLDADIKSQRQKLKDEIASVAAGIGNAAKIAKQRERDLQDAVAAQKARLLRLNEGRDELNVLIRDVEQAQKAYDVATQRFTQTNIEGQANQTNVLLLNEAVEPTKPSWPRRTLNLALAIGLGLFLGVNFAFLRELFDRRVRSYVDLRDRLGLPVLAELENTAMLKFKRRWQRKPRKVGVGSGPGRLLPGASQ